MAWMKRLNQRLAEIGRWIGLDGLWHLYPDCHGTIPQAFCDDDLDLEEVFWIDPDVSGACQDCIKRWKEEVHAARRPKSLLAVREARLKALSSSER